MLINKTRHKLENLMDDGYHLSNDDVFSVCDICGDSFEDIKKIPGKKDESEAFIFSGSLPKSKDLYYLCPRCSLLDDLCEEVDLHNPGKVNLSNLLQKIGFFECEKCGSTNTKATKRDTVGTKPRKWKIEFKGLDCGDVSRSVYSTTAVEKFINRNYKNKGKIINNVFHYQDDLDFD